MRDIDDDYYGLRDNCDPLTLSVAVVLVTVTGVSLWYCAVKNDEDRCEGVGKVVDNVAKLGKIIPPIQFR